MRFGSMLHNGIFKGWVRHRRFSPKSHEFKYPFAMISMDTDQVEECINTHRFWSFEKFNVLSFYRKDFLASKTENLNQAVSETIFDKTGRRFQGTVKLVGLFRSFGFYFNSVSFYFCYEGDELAFIVAEINNTPWDERYAYVMDIKQGEQIGRAHYFDFDKQFHVSPFMPMNLHYHWTFLVKEDQLVVQMDLFNESGEKCFDSTMNLSHTPFTQKSMSWFPIVYPLQGWMMLSRIYIQAFRLWLKKIPFISHPNTQTTSFSSQDLNPSKEEIRK